MDYPIIDAARARRHSSRCVEILPATGPSRCLHPRLAEAEARAQAIEPALSKLMEAKPAKIANWRNVKRQSGHYSGRDCSRKR